MITLGKVNLSRGISKLSRSSKFEYTLFSDENSLFLSGEEGGGIRK